MTKIKKTIKAWSYIRLLKKIAKYQRQGYTYDKIYKGWMLRQCVTMTKEMPNG